ncbi:putative regulator of chromosome condensation protein [Lasiosphaeria ovina]|uniref:Regulator of chromosome condensation protein n=1 Tax=Lasiosphaeria ovina TaxID=92902 RepID=A0AAE0TYU0_9PEZI|nr:putative regulator of chromosome condensation protein [Lasiosphaeria ovina]
MPPKRTSARAAAAATTTTATAKPAASATKKAAPVETKKKTVAATKPKPAATKPKPAATKPKPVAPKKPTPAAARKAQKASEESDKENVGGRPLVNGVKRKRGATPDESEDESAEEDAESDVEMADSDGAEESDVPAPASKRAKKDQLTARPTKKTKVAPAEAAPKKAAAPKKVAAPKKEAAPKKVTKPAKKQLKVINEVPKRVMDIFVFGEGSSGELGLGAVKVDGKKPIDVKRPRFNSALKKVVQVACGGMHVAALTSDNKILTWGVNDQGALGRDTTWDGGLRDVDAEDSDDDDEDSGLNPNESNPAEIDTSEVPEDTNWVQVVASDSATFALTDTGLVYGWGTFRSNEGILGFSRTVLIQKLPSFVPELSKIKQLAAGSNHILALDEKNKIFAWGAGQQAQLARRLLERDDHAALYPSGIGSLPGRAKAEDIECGSYHCFVVDTRGRVIGWGLNNYAELGISTEAGNDGGYILKPQLIDSLSDFEVAGIAGGEHHSLACTKDGKLLTWGRIDGHQVGQPTAVFTEDNSIFDENGKPRILLNPTAVAGVSDVVHVAAGTDHSFAVTAQGKVYSWGFSANYQTGQGTDDDIETPTLIDNSAIRDRKIVWAGAGGQYSILGAEP